MKHPIHKIISVSIVGPYVLVISFDDKTVKEINFKPMLKGEMYGPLINLSLFNQATIDPETHTLVWPNGADFDPLILHDWEKYFDEIAERAKAWEELETV